MGGRTVLRVLVEEVLNILLTGFRGRPVRNLVRVYVEPGQVGRVEGGQLVKKLLVDSLGVALVELYGVGGVEPHGLGRLEIQVVVLWSGAQRKLPYILALTEALSVLAVISEQLAGVRSEDFVGLQFWLGGQYLKT